jgi:hypothetical protein
MPTSIHTIDWTAAAIIAAAVAGAFTLTKEFLNFLLDRTKSHYEERREQRRLLGRVGHHYFEIALGASDALSVWETLDQLRVSVSHSRRNPPSIALLQQFKDSQTPKQIVDLAYEWPDLVKDYLELLRTVDTIEFMLKLEEASHPGDEDYLYPNTRDALAKILKRAARGLQDVATILNRRWNPNRYQAGQKYLRLSADFDARAKKFSTSLDSRSM